MYSHFFLKPNLKNINTISKEYAAYILICVVVLGAVQDMIYIIFPFFLSFPWLFNLVLWSPSFFFLGGGGAGVMIRKMKSFPILKNYYDR